MDFSNILSKAVKSIPPSGIRKFFDLANEMKDAISLSIGEPDFVTPLKVREAGIKSLNEGHTHYSPNSGFIDLRREISNYMNRKYNLSYKPETDILVTVGGSEAIDIAVRALVEPGDEVIVPEPCFVSYKACVVLAGGVPVPIVLKGKDEFRLKPEDLEAAITPKTKLIILGYPNNPTGAIMTKEDLAKIVEVLKDKGIMVISDELYAELTYSGKHVSIANFEEMKDKTIVVNGLSKAFAMTGWRLGYACGHPEIIGAMYKIHQYAIMCSPTTAQYAAVEALRNCDEEVEEMVKEYNRRRRLVVNAFRESGIECFEPLGAFYVFPYIGSTGLSSEEFCERFLMEEKVAIVPGTAFSEYAQGYARVCYARSIEEISIAMERLKNFIKRL